MIARFSPLVHMLTLNLLEEASDCKDESRKLRFINRNLSGNALKELILAKEKGLEEISLLNSWIDAQGIEILADLVSENVKTLEILRLYSVFYDLKRVIRSVCVCDCTIHTLDLSEVDIDKDGFEMLKEMITRNKRLRKLSLSQVEAHGFGFECIADSIAANRSISCVNLSGNRLNYSDLERSIRFNLENSFIQELHLYGNNFQLDGCRLICKALEKNNSLKRLNIAANKFDGHCAIHLSQLICLNSSIEDLNISYNSLGLEGCKVISKALEFNKSIKVFDISANNVFDKGCEYLAEMISVNENLNRLSVVDESVGFIGMCSLIHSVKKLSRNVYLKLNRCKGFSKMIFYEEIFEKCNDDPSFAFEEMEYSDNLIKYLSNCRNLSNVNMKNKISDELLSNCIDVLAPRNQLQSIDISGNYGAEKFCSAIFKTINSLSYLDLSENSLSDSECIILSQFMSSSKCVLKSLNISKNSISEKGCSALFASMIFIKDSFSLAIQSCKLNCQCVRSLPNLFYLNRKTPFQIDLANNEITSESLVDLSWSLAKYNVSSIIDLRNNPFRLFVNGQNYILKCSSEGMKRIKMFLLENEETAYLFNELGLQISTSCVVIEPSSVYIDVPPKELNISFVPDYDPVIGRGSFAEVYECYCDGFFQKNIGTVLKSIYPVEISLSKQILRELEVWNRLNHENIVKFYGIIRPDRLTLNKSDTLQLKFLIEKCQFVLHDYIIQISSDYPGFPDILHIALDISRGMTYLHSQKIIHLDLHSKNILLSTHLKYTAKISDFGLSRRIDDLEHVQLCRLSSNTVICRHIMAPEADQDEAVVGYATDVYSFGIILWEMLTLHNVIQWACINQRDSLGIVIVEIVQGNRDEQEMWLNLWEQRFSNLPIVCILQSSLFSKRDQIALFDMLELCLSCLNPDAGSRPAFSEIFDRISALVDQNSK